MGTSCHLIVTMVQRLTYRRRQSYATKSNKVRKVKTPGGLLTFHNVGKKAAKIKCGDCGLALQGIPALRPCCTSVSLRTKRLLLVPTVDPAAPNACATGSFVPSSSR